MLYAEKTTSSRRILESVVEEVTAVEELLSAYAQLIDEESKRLQEAKVRIGSWFRKCSCYSCIACC